MYRLKVSQYTDAVETRKFKGLADYALACLAVPVSNATTKQLFFHGFIYSKNQKLNKIYFAKVDIAH